MNLRKRARTVHELETIEYVRGHNVLDGERTADSVVNRLTNLERPEAANARIHGKDATCLGESLAIEPINVWAFHLKRPLELLDTPRQCHLLALDQFHVGVEPDTAHTGGSIRYACFHHGATTRDSPFRERRNNTTDGDVFAQRCRLEIEELAAIEIPPWHRQ